MDGHTTDWQAAFGFASDPKETKEKHNDDDLGRLKPLSQLLISTI